MVGTKSPRRGSASAADEVGVPRTRRDVLRTMASLASNGSRTLVGIEGAKPLASPVSYTGYSGLRPLSGTSQPSRRPLLWSG